MNSDMFLTILGESPVEETDSIELVLYGTTNVTQIDYLTLYIGSESGIGNLVETQLPLFVYNTETGATSRNINLFISGENRREYDTVELFLYNAQHIQDNELELFISGLGVWEDAMLLESNMNLFLRRAPMGYLPLMLRGPGEMVEGDEMLLFVAGHMETLGQITLCIFSAKDGLVGDVDIFISGF